MELLELTNKGWSEIIIDSDCEVYKFFKIADVMETKLRIAFGERVKMVEEVYWPFNSEGKIFRSRKPVLIQSCITVNSYLIAEFSAE